MVPHRQILRALTLVGLVRPDGGDVVAALAEDLRVAFPCEIDEFAEVEVFPYLGDAVSVWLTTTDPALTHDFRPFFAAARLLGVQDVVAVDADGPVVRLGDDVLKWRANKTMRMFLETCMLAGVPRAVVAEDLRRVYGADVCESDLAEFERLFVDRDFCRGENWLMYMDCIGMDEAKFKVALMGQPHEFVRWKLGVPVQMDTDRVLDRMVSDAYFTERQLKHEAGENGVHLGRDDLARLKLERDTLFKALDRRLKLQELSALGGGNSDEAESAANQLKEIVLRYADHRHDLVADKLAENGEEPAPTIRDLEDEHGAA